PAPPAPPPPPGIPCAAAIVMPAANAAVVTNNLFLVCLIRCSSRLGFSPFHFLAPRAPHVMENKCAEAQFRILRGFVVVPEFHRFKVLSAAFYASEFSALAALIAHTA